MFAACLDPVKAAGQKLNTPTPLSHCYFKILIMSSRCCGVQVYEMKYGYSINILTRPVTVVFMLLYSCDYRFRPTPYIRILSLISLIKRKKYNTIKM